MGAGRRIAVWWPGVLGCWLPATAPMATSTSTSSLLPPLLPAPASSPRFHPSPSASPRHLRLPPTTLLLRAARRRHPNDAVVVVPDARPWVGDLSGATASYRKGGEDEEDDSDEDEEEEEDRSLDLLARFLHSVFRKASRRARRAARSVLPPSVPAELVKFSVNGVLVLTFLWILKGLLEVVCTFGSMVFASILLVRGIWSGVTYIRENQYSYIHRIDNEDTRWGRVQTAA